MKTRTRHLNPGVRPLPIAGAFLLIGLLSVGVSGAETEHDGADLDCATCHSCDQPTRCEPCLNTRFCERHDAMANLEVDLGPEVVILDELERLYVPVRFDHKSHARMAQMDGGCESCHHFTPPNAEHPACKSCHPKDIRHEDIVQPGLKGAYHRNCMSCHLKWDADTACEICHEKKVQGEPSKICEHSHYDPVQLIDLIIFTTDSDEGERVPFHHRSHSQRYERDCSSCHQAQRCTRCHIQETGFQGPQVSPAESRDLHDVCGSCHDVDNCVTCHGRSVDDVFNHAATGWPLARYHAELSCDRCHARREGFATLDRRCEHCHPGATESMFDHRVTGVRLDDTHMALECADCHVDGLEAPTDCMGCHDEKPTHHTTVGLDS